LPLPLALFAVEVIFVMDWFEIWTWVPSAFRYVQFSYRLIGLVQLVGFVLFLQTVGSSQDILGRMPATIRWLLGSTFVTLAILGTSTYWHHPPTMEIKSAEIKPSDIAGLDRCNFCAPTPQSTLQTQAAIRFDQIAAMAPVPIAIPSEGRPSHLDLAGNVLPIVFQMSKEPVTVRLYGFTKTGQGAGIGHIAGLFVAKAGIELLSGPEGSPSSTAAQPASGSDGRANQGVPLPNIPWSAYTLAEWTTSAPGPFSMHVALDPAIAAVAIECSRGVSPQDTNPIINDGRKQCLSVDYLGQPRIGDRFVKPGEFPVDSRTRGALGTVVIDAGDLPAGSYVLPTYDYPFVRVRDAAGALIPTYQFDRRPAIEHPGTPETYTVAYEFDPERLAVITGCVLLLLSAIAIQTWNRTRFPVRQARRRSTSGVASTPS
jgi:hypothetical protein